MSAQALRQLRVQARLLARFRLLTPLLDRNFSIYWIGRTVSLAGDQFQAVALAVIALDLTHSTTALGAVLTVQSIPRALLMLFGGAATDRFRARTVMLVSDALQALVVLGLALLAFGGALSLWHLLVYAVLSGTILAFFLPAAQTIIPELVPSERVQAANALGNTAQNLAVFLIPPVAGIAVAALGAAPAFTINALSFLGSVATLWCVRQQPRLATRSIVRERGFLDHLRGSLVAARRDTPILLTLIIAAVYCSGSFGAIAVALPALAKLTLGAGDAGVGVLLGARGVGALVGGVVVGSIAIRRKGLAGSLVILGTAIAIVAAALAPTIWAAALWLALSGGLTTATGIIYATLCQVRAPDEQRGGIMSLLTVAIFGLTPLGYAGAGLMGGVLGPRGILLFGALTVAASGLLGLAFRSMRDA